MSQRLAGVTFSKPFLYGNASFLLPQKEGDNSHRWVLYVRGLDNEDLSSYIKSVTFKLHESFAEPVRVVSQPPYEVSELGWGEFTVQIIITFVDAIQEEPLSLQHHLRLFGDGATPAGPLIFEKYDEAVFVSPTPQALAILKDSPTVPLPNTLLTPFFAKSTAAVRAAEARQLDRLGAAQQQIRRALERLRARLYEVDTEIAELETPNRSAPRFHTACSPKRRAQSVDPSAMSAFGFPSSANTSSSAMNDDGDVPPPVRPSAFQPLLPALRPSAANDRAGEAMSDDAHESYPIAVPRYLPFSPTLTGTRARTHTPATVSSSAAAAFGAPAVAEAGEAEGGEELGVVRPLFASPVAGAGAGAGAGERAGAGAGAGAEAFPMWSQYTTSNSTPTFAAAPAPAAPTAPALVATPAHPHVHAHTHAHALTPGPASSRGSASHVSARQAPPAVLAPYINSASVPHSFAQSQGHGHGHGHGHAHTAPRPGAQARMPARASAAPAAAAAAAEAIAAERTRAKTEMVEASLRARALQLIAHAPPMPTAATTATAAADAAHDGDLFAGNPSSGPAVGVTAAAEASALGAGAGAVGMGMVPVAPAPAPALASAPVSAPAFASSPPPSLISLSSSAVTPWASPQASPISLSSSSASPPPVPAGASTGAGTGASDAAGYEVPSAPDTLTRYRLLLARTAAAGAAPLFSPRTTTASQETVGTAVVGARAPFLAALAARVLPLLQLEALRLAAVEAAGTVEVRGPHLVRGRVLTTGRPQQQQLGEMSDEAFYTSAAEKAAAAAAPLDSAAPSQARTQQTQWATGSSSSSSGIGPYPTHPPLPHSLSTIYHSNSFAEVSASALRTLSPGQWLNDEVINGYLALLLDRARRESGPRGVVALTEGATEAAAARAAGLGGSWNSCKAPNAARISSAAAAEASGRGGKSVKQKAEALLFGAPPSQSAGPAAAGSFLDQLASLGLGSFMNTSHGSYSLANLLSPTSASTGANSLSQGAPLPLSHLPSGGSFLPIWGDSQSLQPLALALARARARSSSLTPPPSATLPLTHPRRPPSTPATVAAALAAPSDVAAPLGGRLNIHIFLSQFFSVFASRIRGGLEGDERPNYDYALVRRWSKRAGVRVWGLDKLILPCHVHGNHWTLLCADFRRREIQFYDSLQGRMPSAHVECLRRYLQDEAKEYEGVGTGSSSTERSDKSDEELGKVDTWSDAALLYARKADSSSGSSSSNGGNGSVPAAPHSFSLSPACVGEGVAHARCPSAYEGVLLGWRDVRMRDIPLQENGYDCGVYLLCMAEHVARDAPLGHRERGKGKGVRTAFVQQDVPGLRLKVALQLEGCRVP